MLNVVVVSAKLNRHHGEETKWKGSTDEVDEKTDLHGHVD